MLLVEGAIDLRAGAPDRGALFPVQNLELDAGLVNDAAGHAVEGVNLAQDGALADAAKGRVAGADAQIVELGRDERGAGAGAGGGGTSLGAGVAASYDDDIECPVNRLIHQVSEGAHFLCCTWRERVSLAYLASGATEAKPLRRRANRLRAITVGLLRPRGAHTFCIVRSRLGQMKRQGSQ